MKSGPCSGVTFSLIALATGLYAPWPAKAQTSEVRYASMAPLAKYLETDTETEIAVARSAAPVGISGHATVLVLRSTGYQTAARGTGGFVCLVERGWMGPLDWSDFWNPKIRGPICFNPQAARTVLPITMKRTQLVLGGMNKTQMVAALKTAIDHGDLPTLEPGAMSYMMSKDGYMGAEAGHWHPHLMFYAARSDGSDWGADVSGSPVQLNPQFQGAPEPLTTYVVPVPNWSDGSQDDMHVWTGVPF